MPVVLYHCTARWSEQQGGKCCEEDVTFMRQMTHLVLGQFFFPSNTSLEKGKRKQWVIVSFIFGVNIKINVQLYYFSKQRFVVFRICPLLHKTRHSQQNL